MGLTSEQHEMIAHAELVRGCGIWPQQSYPCRLEPPCEPWAKDQPTAWAAWLKEREGLELTPLHDANLEGCLEPTFEYVPIVVEHFHEDETPLERAEQLLRSMSSYSHPIAFEIIGVGPQPIYDGCSEPGAIMERRRKAVAPSGWHEPNITVQFTAHWKDAPLLHRQLLAHFPNSGVTVGEALSANDLIAGHDLAADVGWGTTFALSDPYLRPLKLFKGLDVDPLSIPLAAMADLGRYEWAQVQVLLAPTRSNWEAALRDAVQHPYPHAAGNNAYIFTDITDRDFRDKFSSPLFAVSVRIAALKWPTYRHLLGWAEQFAAHGQSFFPRDDDDMDYLGWSLMARCAFSPGALLNTSELAGLVHIPSSDVYSERLRRVEARTRPAVPIPDDAGAIILGDNIHQGNRQVARIPADLRPRHCYIAGASGTGKSTLLLNSIMQDVAAGRGVGVLDPHGDLINAVLPRIPPHRVRDVVLFDPTDREYPFALNILSAKDAEERERIVDETIMALQRYFPASWGPRLERILTFAIKGVLDADPTATLVDVERMLVDDEFRLTMAARMTGERYQRFWTDEYPKLGKAANDPVLNKLSVFVEKRVVRNIVCQRRCAVDFDHVLNSRKIFLANLSTGMLNESVANILGSFLVTKIINAAFRRASVPPDRRVPFYLYIDEFQNFMGVSVGFERILAESRKYNLVLAGLANQYIGQLSPTVRQAIFGNIGVMVVFRLGVEDANIASREMGVFTAEEILNLELGEAIARAGGSKTAYNLKTYPNPPTAESDPTVAIRARMRREFARPREEVERELAAVEKAVEIAPPPSSGIEPPLSKSAKPHKARQQNASDASKWPPGHVLSDKSSEPTDPKEEDLVR